MYGSGQPYMCLISCRSTDYGPTLDGNEPYRTSGPDGGLCKLCDGVSAVFFAHLRFSSGDSIVRYFALPAQISFLLPQ